MPPGHVNTVNGNTVNGKKRQIAVLRAHKCELTQIVPRGFVTRFSAAECGRFYNMSIDWGEKRMNDLDNKDINENQCAREYDSQDVAAWILICIILALINVILAFI